jgi:hypothetical protein
VTENGTIKIYPIFPYKQAIDEGKEMDGLSYWYIPFEYEFPALSVKVVNNTANSLLLSEIVVDVNASEVDLSPILFVNDVYYYGSLSLENEGWGKVVDPKLSLCFFAPGQFPEFDEAKAKTVELDDFTEAVYLNITDQVDEDLKEKLLECSSKIDKVCVGSLCTYASENLQCADQSNGDLCKQLTTQPSKEFIKDLLDRANEYSDGEKYSEKDIRYEKRCRDYPLDVVGVLSFREEESTTEKKFRFRTVVHLGEPGVGAPAPPTFYYDLFLEAGKSGYSLRLPISQEIKPGDSDHFVINIASNKSSSFDLKFTVFDTKKRPVKTSKVSINMIVPRSGLRYAQRHQSDI